MSATPVSDAMRAGGQWNAAWDEMAVKLARFATADGWVGPNELLLTAARR